MVLAGTGAPSLARAAEDQALAQAKLVPIHVDGDATALARTRAVASELLERLGVTALVTTEAELAGESSGRVLARAYFDLRDPSRPSIVVVEESTDRELLRRTFPDSASLEIAVEELAHVLYSVVEALLNTERKTLEERPSAPPPVPPPKVTSRVLEPPPPVEPPPPRERGLPPSVSIGAFARLLALDSSSILPGAGVEFGVRSRGRGVAFGGSLVAAMQAADFIAFEEARGGVRPVSFRAYATATGAGASSISLTAGLGAGVDWLRVETESLPIGARVEARTVVDPIVGSVLGARFPLGRHVSLDAAFTLDVDLIPRRFVAEQGERRSVLLELARFRPAFLLGGSYWLFDEKTKGGEP